MPKKGFKQSPEHIAKLSAIRRGRVMPKATRRKISDALSGVPKTKQHVRAVQASRRVTISKPQYHAICSANSARKWRLFWAKLSRKIELPLALAKKLKRGFNLQRLNAKRRGVVFKMTFEDWAFIWKESGHAYERGPCHDQYCMARKGDRGPYAVGNVMIITGAANVAQSTFRKR